MERVATLRAIRTSLILIAMILASASAHSTVEVTSESPGHEPGSAMLRIAVTETIFATDSIYFRVIVRTLDAKYKKWWAVVDLDSHGGSIQAALDIGTVLRERGLAALVDRGASCMSACVYVLAGAPTRIVNQYARIGIHRPYEPDDTVDSAAQQRLKQAELGRRITAYLQSMTLPTRLYEDSVFISPDRMKILSRAEIESYGLNANDPSVEEAEEVRQAKGLGITRVELGKRKAEARRRCGMDRMSDDTPFAELSRAALCMDKYVKGR